MFARRAEIAWELGLFGVNHAPSAAPKTFGATNGEKSALLFASSQRQKDKAHISSPKDFGVKYAG